MNIFFNLLRNIVTIEKEHGRLRQIDAELPNGKPVRILASPDGYHVSVGKIPWRPPEPVSAREAAHIILRESREGA
jgi:hypothetical protein